MRQISAGNCVAMADKRKHRYEWTGSLNQMLRLAGATKTGLGSHAPVVTRGCTPSKACILWVVCFFPGDSDPDAGILSLWGGWRLSAMARGVRRTYEP